MSFEKLISQLRRDIAASPKKAAALGLMVVVALYFWGPLVWKFIHAGSGPDSPSKVTSLILTDDPVAPAQQRAAAGGRARFHWEKARQLIQQDPRMQSAAFDSTWTSPFGKPTPVVLTTPPAAEQPSEDEAAAAVAVAAIDPQSIGLTLGGIVLGAGKRLAIVNGQVCREGEVISVLDKRDKETKYELRVARVNRQSVEFDLGGRSFQLELSSPQLAHGDDLERGRTAERNP